MTARTGTTRRRLFDATMRLARGTGLAGVTVDDGPDTGLNAYLPIVVVCRAIGAMAPLGGKHGLSSGL